MHAVFAGGGRGTSPLLPGHRAAKNGFLGEWGNQGRDEGLDRGSRELDVEPRFGPLSLLWVLILFFHLFPSVSWMTFIWLLATLIYGTFGPIFFCWNFFIFISVKSMKTDLRMNLYFTSTWVWQFYIILFSFEVSTCVFVFTFFLKHRAHVLQIRILPAFCRCSRHRWKTGNC